MESERQQPSLKLRTAQTLKWNTIDKLSTQVLYAITGIILARELSKEDFGLVGVLLVFQAFASVFVDSGFASALIQRHSPDSKDYSTVFFFNLAVSIILYTILFICAPLIGSFFGNEELVPLSRVMFLTLIINSTLIVQSNRLMKQMNVKLITISNTVALAASGSVGIVMAFTGFGAWALVWQAITLSTIKSAILWIFVKWRPMLYFSIQRLKSFFAVGSGVMISSFLNTLSQNIYPFIIGAFKTMTDVGLYTQADKWSKMGIMSLSQTLTSTFLPLISEMNSDRERLLRVINKTNKLSCYILFPAFFMLIVMATPIFHLLFGTKWDDAILLFQILMMRGVFVVLTLVYNNYILALGKAKRLVYSEIVKDIVTAMAIVLTVGYGFEALVWGQLGAAIVCWIYTLWLTSITLSICPFTLIKQAVPYICISIIALIPAILIFLFCPALHPAILILLQFISATIIYLAINAMFKSKIQKDVICYITNRKLDF